MGQVNRIPNGFLDLLGVQSLGKNPPAFADAIGPVVDLFEMYAAQTLSAHSEIITHNAVSDQLVIFVPEGETWLIRAISFYGAGGAPGTGVREQWLFKVDNPPRAETPSGTTVEGWYAELYKNTAGAQALLADALTLPAPIMCTSGCALVCRLTDRSGAGNRDTEITYLISRFKS